MNNRGDYAKPAKIICPFYPIGFTLAFYFILFYILSILQQYIYNSINKENESEKKKKILKSQGEWQNEKEELKKKIIN